MGWTAIESAIGTTRQTVLKLRFQLDWDKPPRLKPPNPTPPQPTPSPPTTPTQQAIGWGHTIGPLEKRTAMKG